MDDKKLYIKVADYLYENVFNKDIKQMLNDWLIENGRRYFLDFEEEVTRPLFKDIFFKSNYFNDDERKTLREIIYENVILTSKEFRDLPLDEEIKYIELIEWYYVEESDYVYVCNQLGINFYDYDEPDHLFDAMKAAYENLRKKDDDNLEL